MSRHMDWFYSKQSAKCLAVFAILALFAACATSTDPVTLRHPQTGHAVECGARSLDCLHDYQLQGYQSVPN